MSREGFSIQNLWAYGLTKLLVGGLGGGLVYGAAAYSTGAAYPGQVNRTIVPRNAPIVVRGGSVRAVCRSQNCKWDNSKTAVRSTNISGPIKTIYLEDVGTGPHDVPINPPAHWQITLTFRKSDGHSQNDDGETLSICTDLDANNHCTYKDSGVPNTLYLQGSAGGFKDETLDLPGVIYKKSTCSGDTTSDPKCNHIYDVTVTWDPVTMSLPGTTTYSCGDGACAIWLDTK